MSHNLGIQLTLGTLGTREARKAGALSAPSVASAPQAALKIVQVEASVCLLLAFIRDFTCINRLRPVTLGARLRHF